MKIKINELRKLIKRILNEENEKYKVKPKYNDFIKKFGNEPFFKNLIKKLNSEDLNPNTSWELVLQLTTDDLIELELNEENAEKIFNFLQGMDNNDVRDRPSSQHNPVGFMFFKKSDGTFVTIMTPWDLETKELIEGKNKYILEDIPNEETLKILNNNINKFIGKKKEEIMEALQFWTKKLEFDEFDPTPVTKNPFPKSTIQQKVWRLGDIEYNKNQGGIWFGETKDGVETFIRKVYNTTGVAKPYYINLENPKYYDSFWNDYIPKVQPSIYNKYEDYVSRDELAKTLIGKGHDGIYIGNSIWSDTDTDSVESEQYVVFNPKNVRLAE